MMAAAMREGPIQHSQIQEFPRSAGNPGVHFLVALAQLQRRELIIGVESEGPPTGKQEWPIARSTRRSSHICGVTVMKAMGRKIIHQRKSGGHHRQSDFLGGSDRSKNAVSSLLFHESKNIFENDDGIVDDDATASVNARSVMLFREKSSRALE